MKRAYLRGKTYYLRGMLAAAGWKFDYNPNVGAWVKDGDWESLQSVKDEVRKFFVTDEEALNVQVELGEVPETPIQTRPRRFR